MPHVYETGVYLIRHKESGKVYVGGAYKTFKKRLDGHRKDLRLGRHANQHLQSAWSKYGSGAFEFVILERCSVKVCDVRETFWIRFYKAADRRFGYNKSPSGGSMLGFKHSEDSKSKMRAAKIGRKLSQEAIDKRTAKVTGAKRSDATKRRMSEAAKKRGISNETRAKMVEWMHSDEGKSKLSSWQIGKVMSESAKQKMSEAQKRRYEDPEQRKKMGDLKRGNKYASGKRTPEQIAKMTKANQEAAKRRKEKKDAIIREQPSFQQGSLFD